jgi:hypothetical protein
MVQLDKALKELAKVFKKESVKVVLIGGIACGIWKHIRATKDIDFLLDSQDYEKVIQIMKHLGYEGCKEFKKLGIVKFPEVTAKGLAEVDFVVANQRYLKEIFETAPAGEFDGEDIFVSDPEQLIILKLKAIHDNPARELDWFDIKSLIRLNRANVRVKVILSFLKKFKLMDKSDEIEKEFNKID